jgi:hypothetical protein
METVNLDRGRENISSSGKIVTQEEHDALIYELTREAKPEHVASITVVDEKLRKLEFDMMVLVGLILIVFLLCRGT